MHLCKAFYTMKNHGHKKSTLRGLLRSSQCPPKLKDYNEIGWSVLAISTEVLDLGKVWVVNYSSTSLFRRKSGVKTTTALVRKRLHLFFCWEIVCKVFLSNWMLTVHRAFKKFETVQYAINWKFLWDKCFTKSFIIKVNMNKHDHLIIE